MIKPESVQRVKDLHIYDVLSSELSLTRRGKFYECCCPFHSERTPSFKIDPSKNTWRCYGSCQEGGNAIDFFMKRDNLTFTEAVEHIASLCNINLDKEDRPLLPEEVEAGRKKESLKILLKLVQEFYEEQLSADNPDAQKARDYVYGRWPKEFCDEFGIGYAPRDSRLLLDFIKRKGLSEDLAMELGLIGVNEARGKTYAAFYDRITIPFRDLYCQPIAFTCRSLSEDKKYAKYKNSSTNELIFRKSEFLFNLDDAKKNTSIDGSDRSSPDHIIIVEGAPDAMRLRSIGIKNVVALLGTAQSDKQLDLLWRYTHALRYIPDSDYAEPGIRFSPGISAVLKNGAAALRRGFTVSVKEIPRTKKDDEQKVKHDADSYIQSPAIYRQLDDVPFVIWYARKMFEGIDNDGEKMGILKDVAELLYLIKDDLTVSMYIDMLCKIYGKAKNWRDALKNIDKKRKMQKAIEAEKARQEILDKADEDSKRMYNLGIQVEDGCYIGYDDDGNSTRWSNFTMEGILHVMGQEQSTRVIALTNRFGEKTTVEFKAAELATVRDFTKRLLRERNFIFRAGQPQLIALQEYLFETMETAYNIEYMGYNERDDFYAFANGIYKDGNFIPIDKLGRVKTANKTYFLPALSEMYIEKIADFSFERMFQHSGGSGLTLYDFSEKIIESYGDGAKVGLAWTFACMFRDIIFKDMQSFPVLNLFGRKGSGKTDLAVALASFFYVMKKTPSSCTNTTIPTIAYILSHAINALIILDEFTNELKDNRVDILKGLWGGTSQSKMNVEDKRPMTIPVTSGVILAGQYKPEDEAIFSRSIHLQYNETKFSQAQMRRHDKLMEDVRRGNSHLLFPILELRRVIEKGFSSTFDIVMDDVCLKLKGMQVETRVMKNWLVPLTVFRLLEPHINVPFSYTELFDICVKGLLFQNDQIAESSDTADFWKFIDSLHTSGKVKEKCHYKIRTVSQFLSDEGIKAKPKKEPTKFIQPKRIIYLNFPAIRILLEQRIARQKNGNTVSIDTLLDYLKALPEYLGHKSCRFQFLRANGDLETESENNNGQYRTYAVGNSAKAMCFDYDAIKEKLEINLETIRIATDLLDDDDDEPQLDLTSSSLTASTVDTPDVPTDKTLFDEEDGTPF